METQPIFIDLLSFVAKVSERICYTVIAIMIYEWLNESIVSTVQVDNFKDNSINI